MDNRHFLLFEQGLSESLIRNLILQHPLATVLPISLGFFPSGEEFVEFFPFDKQHFHRNAALLQDSTVTIVQSISNHSAENLMYAHLAIDTAKRAGARSVHAIFPYMAYMRQDRSAHDRERFESVANALIPKHLAASGLDRIGIVSPHSQASIDQYRAVFGANFIYEDAINLLANHLVAKYSNRLNEIVVGAPDAAKKHEDQAHFRTVAIAKLLFQKDWEAHFFEIEKERIAPGKSVVKNVYGDVKGKLAIIIDDMIDSGNTLLKAAEALKSCGAHEVCGVAVHGIFSSRLLPLLMARDKEGSFIFSRIIVTNSLPIEKIILKDKFPLPHIEERTEIVDISSLISRMITQLKSCD